MPSKATMFLQIDGISGTSKNRKHKNWIEINSFSFNAYRSTNFVGSGQSRVRSVEAPQIGDISISRSGDSCSVDLFALSVSPVSDTPKNATISICNDGSKEPIAQYKLTDILITQYSVSGSGGGYGGGLNESFGISFVEVDVTHFPVKDKDEEEEDNSNKEVKVKEEPKSVTYNNKTGLVV